MPKRLILIVILVVAIVSALTYLVMHKRTDDSVANTTTDQQVSASPEQNSQQSQGTGKYIDYSASSLAATKGKRYSFFTLHGVHSVVN